LPKFFAVWQTANVPVKLLILFTQKICAKIGIILLRGAINQVAKQKPKDFIFFHKLNKYANFGWSGWG
jgi:hypothetical protein